MSYFYASAKLRRQWGVTASQPLAPIATASLKFSPSDSDAGPALPCASLPGHRRDRPRRRMREVAHRERGAPRGAPRGAVLPARGRGVHPGHTCMPSVPRLPYAGRRSLRRQIARASRFTCVLGREERPVLPAGRAAGESPWAGKMRTLLGHAHREPTRPLVVLRLHGGRQSGDRALGRRRCYLVRPVPLARAGFRCIILALSEGLPRRLVRASLNPPGKRSLSVANPQLRDCLTYVRPHSVAELSEWCLPPSPALGSRAGLEPFPVYYKFPWPAAGVAGRDPQEAGWTAQEGCAAPTAAAFYFHMEYQQSSSLKPRFGRQLK